MLRRCVPLVLLACGLLPPRALADTPVTVTAIDQARIPAGGAGSVSGTVTFPEGQWSSVRVSFADAPSCDPWDRLFSVAVDGVEVLRGTTPRTAFQVGADVTPYEYLLSGQHTVTAYLPNYWAAQYSDCGSAPADAQKQWHQVTVSFTFTPGAPPAGLPSTGLAPWYLQALHNPGGDPGCTGSNPDGIDSSAQVTIPPGGFAHAAFYGYLTSHGCEEQWFANPLPNGNGADRSPAGTCSPAELVACALRTTHLLVDGQEVGSWNPKPYTYAFVGFVGGETPRSGPLPGTTTHQIMWWTAQDEANQLGVYTGVGVIPPYVLDLSGALGRLGAGPHTVELRIDGGDSYWMTSGELLLG